MTELQKDLPQETEFEMPVILQNDCEALPSEKNLPDLQAMRQQIIFYDRVQSPMERAAQSVENAKLMPLKRDYPANDYGNARRFLDICQDFVRYCPAEKRWYIFNRTRWAPDNANLIQRLAQISLEISYGKEADYLKEHGSYQELQQLLRSQTKAGNFSTIQNCLNMASASAVITPDQFDRDPYWFHAGNGALNLQTFTGILYHEKKLLFTKTAGASLQTQTPDGTHLLEPRCPRWIQFVKECCSGDEELYNYLQKAAGYSILTGDIREQKVFCLLGAGRNGKSLFINTLAAIAGDYASKIESSVLCVNRFGDKDGDMSKELFRIRGSRFVYSNEFSRSSTLNETFIKNITDGGQIACRPLYGASITYTPTYTLWFSTNHMPNLQAMDEGIRRRIVIIPFRNNLTEDQIDRTLAQTLLQEADEILYWLIEGYYRYTVHGLQPPAAVQNTTASYFEEQDIFQIFISEHYTPDASGKVYAKTLYQNYQHWCDENGEKSVSNITLSKELQRLNVIKNRDRNGTYYLLAPKRDEAF